MSTRHSEVGSTMLPLKEGEKSTREDVEKADINDLEIAQEQSNDEKLVGEQGPEDPFLVEWEENDPENPLNFTMARKVLLMAMIAAIAFLTYFLQLGDIKR